MMTENEILDALIDLDHIGEVPMPPEDKMPDSIRQLIDEGHIHLVSSPDGGVLQLTNAAHVRLAAAIDDGDDDGQLGSDDDDVTGDETDPADDDETDPDADTVVTTPPLDPADIAG